MENKLITQTYVKENSDYLLSKYKGQFLIFKVDKILGHNENYKDALEEAGTKDLGDLVSYYCHPSKYEIQPLFSKPKFDIEQSEIL